MSCREPIESPWNMPPQVRALVDRGRELGAIDLDRHPRDKVQDWHSRAMLAAVRRRLVRRR